MCTDEQICRHHMQLINLSWSYLTCNMLVQKSDIWKFFDKNYAVNVSCNICGVKGAYCRSTIWILTNMHLKH